MSTDEAAELLAEALRTQAGDTGRQTRNVDARVPRAVCRALAPALSMARVAAGLRVLLGEAPAEGVLADAERGRLAGVLGESTGPGPTTGSCSWRPTSAGSTRSGRGHAGCPRTVPGSASSRCPAEAGR